MRSTLAVAVMALTLLSTSAALAESKKYDVKVEGMHCAPCVQAIKEALNKVDGIEKDSVQVVLKKKSATFTVANDDAQMESKVRQAIEDQGYTVKMINGHKVAAVKTETKQETKTN